MAPEPKKPGFLSRIREEVAPTPAQTARAKAAALADKAAVSVIPPPPDAPGPAGGLLDFVEGLKAPAPAQPRAATLKAAAPPPPAPKAPTVKAEKPAAKKEPAAKAAPVEAPAVAKPRNRAKPAPDIVRKRSWTRGLKSKVAVAASLAAALFIFRDDIPRLLVPPGTSPIATGSISKQEPPAPSGIVASARFKAHDGPLQAIALTGDGRLIVTAGEDRVLRVWNRDTRAPAGTIYMDDGPATSLSVRNHRGLTSHADGSVNVWDLDTQRRLYRFKRNEASVWAATFLGSEDRVAAAGHDWMATLWQTGSETTPARVLEGHESAVQAIASDAAGSWLVTGGADRTVKLWRLDDGQLRRSYRNLPDFVSALSFSGESGLFAAGTLDGSIRLYSTTHNRPLRIFNSHKARVTSLAFSPRGDLMASAAEDGSVRVRGVKSSRPYWTLTALQGGAKTLAFDAGSRQLLTGGQDGIVTLWSLPEPALAQR